MPAWPGRDRRCSRCPLPATVAMWRRAIAVAVERLMVPSSAMPSAPADVRRDTSAAAPYDERVAATGERV